MPTPQKTVSLSACRRIVALLRDDPACTSVTQSPGWAVPKAGGNHELIPRQVVAICAHLSAKGIDPNSASRAIVTRAAITMIDSAAEVNRALEGLVPAIQTRTSAPTPVPAKPKAAKPKVVPVKAKPKAAKPKVVPVKAKVRAKAKETPALPEAPPVAPASDTVLPAVAAPSVPINPKAAGTDHDSIPKLESRPDTVRLKSGQRVPFVHMITVVSTLISVAQLLEANDRFPGHERRRQTIDELIEDCGRYATV